MRTDCKYLYKRPDVSGVHGCAHPDNWQGVCIRQAGDKCKGYPPEKSKQKRKP